MINFKYWRIVCDMLNPPKSSYICTALYTCSNCLSYSCFESNHQKYDPLLWLIVISYFVSVENGLDDLMNKAKQILVSHYQSINTSKEIQMLTKKQVHQNKIVSSRLDNYFVISVGVDS